MSSAAAGSVELRRLVAKNEPSPAAIRAAAAPSYFSEASRPDHGHNHGTIEMGVMLADGNAIKITADLSITADEALDSVIDKMTLKPEEARRVLGLWLVSPSLSLQLKPAHMPYHIARKWPDTLRKYTSRTAAEADKEQPLLMLRRNAFVSREEDLSVTDARVLELLVAEARTCLLSGEWPCTDENLAVQLAGLLACIEIDWYDDAISVYTEDEYRRRLVTLLPKKLRESTASKHELRAKLEAAHQEYSSVHGVGATRSSENSDEEAVGQLYKSFLTVCCELPYYGCVFFDAYVERAHKSLIKGKHQSVVIGVNTSGVFIIDSEKQEPLFGALLTELTWEFVDVCNCVENQINCTHASGYCIKGKDAVPHIFLQQTEDPCDAVATDTSSGDAKTPAKLRILPVFTKAAKLVDALIENVVQMLRAATVSLGTVADEADGVGKDSVDGARLCKASNDSHLATAVAGRREWQDKLRHRTHECCKYERLRVQRYSTQGECLDPHPKK